LRRELLSVPWQQAKAGFKTDRTLVDVATGLPRQA